MTDNTEDTVCQRCGRTLQVGDYPFCKPGESEPHSGGKFSNIKDDIPGGMWLENYGPEPICVYSHTERRAIMKERGLVEKDTHNPLPGSSKSGTGGVRWDSYIDAQTLENARILVTRQAEVDIKRRNNGPSVESFDVDSVIVNRFSKTGTEMSRKARNIIQRGERRVIGIPGQGAK